MPILGRAETLGGRALTGADDPIEPARAVRRALAAAGRRAVEVDRFIVAAPLAPTADACLRFARRALGPHGQTVTVLAVALEGEDADSLAGQAVAALDPGPPGGVGLAICVGLGPDGRTVALCLDHQADPTSGQQRPRDDADDRSAEQ